MNLFLNIVVVCVCLPWPAMIMMSPMMIAVPGFASKKSSILTAMLFFIYPSAVFILLYLTGNAFFGTNPLWWSVVTFAVGVLVVMLYGLPREFYNLSKGISNYDYFIKDNSVYYNGKRIKGSDANSFTHFDNRGYYSKDKNHVYYNSKKITSADPASFQPLAGDITNNYWHDKNNAYYKWNLIKGADGASFMYAGQGYTVDKNNVFFEERLVKEANRTSFKPLKEYVGRDHKNIFVQSMLATNIQDNASFELITMSDEVFGKDDYQIYAIRYAPPFPMLPFPNVDLKTFEIVGEYYAKDKNQVYYYSYHNTEIIVLEEAIPENFILCFDNFRNTNATDGVRYYKSGVLHVE